MSLKETILALRAQGKSYSQIQKEVNCSKGTISFHCNSSTKERAVFRQNCYRKNISFIKLNGKISKENSLEIESSKSCLVCSALLHNTKSNFCSQKCNQLYKFEVRYNNWISGVVENSSRWLRKALTKLHGYKCSTCGLSSWNSKPITLEVEHRDGDSENNEIPNLCLICPNCHSQTSTYKGANAGKGRYCRRIRYAEGKSY